MLRKSMAWLVMLALLIGCAMAEKNEVQITEIATEIGGHFVRYPQLAGMQDEALQRQINDDIVLSSGVSDHLITLVTLGQSPWGLQVDHRSQILDGRVFSTVISAKGKIGNQRDAHVYTALCYDLVSGERLALQDLFADVEAAAAYMEAEAEKSLS